MKIANLLTRTVMGGAALIAFIAAPSAFAQISLTSSSYTQNFNSYVGSAATVPAGWTSSASGYQGVGSTSSSTGGNYASQTGTDRGFGAIRSNSTGNVILGVGFTNNTGSTITSLTLSWNYEQFKFANTSGFDLSGTGGLEGNLILNGKDFSGVASGSGLRSTAVSSFTITGLSIANGDTFGFNWVTTDIASADNGVAIDDFSLTIPTSSNNTEITTTSTVAFGRVVQGTANPTNNVTLNKTGSEATTYTTTAGGQATVADAGTSFVGGTQSDQISVGINRSTTGVKTGTVTVDNTASTSAGAGQGSADPNDVINVSGTVLANRDITAEGGVVDFGKVFEDTDTDSVTVTLNGGAQDDNNGTRVNINEGSVTNNGVTTTYTSGQGDDQFNSANETKTVSVTGNFAHSGLDQPNSTNAAGLLGNGEDAGVGATVDSSVNINYTVDVYQKASLLTDNDSPIDVDEFGASVHVDNAFSDDAGVRASAEIVSKQVSSGWQVTGLDNATIIAEGDRASGTATFDSAGKLAGTHQGTLLLGFQHEDQDIKGAAVNDLGTRTWNFNYTVASATANSGVANVQAGNSYAGYNLTNDAGLATNVALLAGTASATTEVEMTFNSVVPGGFAASNDALRVSDVVNLTGTDGDLIVLQISYDPADIGGALESDLRLAWFDGSDWVLAIDGNTGGTDFFAGDVAWNSGFGLGAYGVDSATNTVWAVINHNSNFSVVAVPEPATWGLLLGAGAVLMAGRRRRVSRNS